MLVEGKDNEVFVLRMTQSMGLLAGSTVIDFDAVPGDVEPAQVANFGGVNELRRKLRLLLAESGFSLVERIAIVRDAEAAEASAWASMVASVQTAGLTPLARLQEYGSAPAPKRCRRRSRKPANPDA